MRKTTVMFTVIATVAVAGCATMNVSSHIERGISFSEYVTYDWGPPDNLPVGDPRLDNNPFFNDYLQGAVEKGLVTRGFELAAGDADLLIHYHANVTRRINVDVVDGPYGYCSQPDCSRDIVEYEAGTLILDIVDARAHRLIWRGWAQTNVDSLLGDPSLMMTTVEQAVARMLLRLPPVQH